MPVREKLSALTSRSAHAGIGDAADLYRLASPDLPLHHNAPLFTLAGTAVGGALGGSFGAAAATGAGAGLATVLANLRHNRAAAARAEQLMSGQGETRRNIRALRASGEWDEDDFIAGQQAFERALPAGEFISDSIGTVGNIMVGAGSGTLLADFLAQRVPHTRVGQVARSIRGLPAMVAGSVAATLLAQPGLRRVLRDRRDSYWAARDQYGYGDSEGRDEE